jgi:DNA transposition AAA+ family ATPase
MAQEQYRLPPIKIITPSKRIKSTELQPIDEENKKTAQRKERLEDTSRRMNRPQQESETVTRGPLPVVTRNAEK